MTSPEDGNKWACRVCGEHLSRRMFIPRTESTAFCVYHDASDLQPDVEPPATPEDGRRVSDERMTCGECGQRVGIAERHTFADCAIWRAKLGGTLEPKYARALAAEIARLTSNVCIHSSVRDDCLSCQHGALLRCDAEIARLRVVVEAATAAEGAELGDQNWWDAGSWFHAIPHVEWLALRAALAALAEHTEATE